MNGEILEMIFSFPFKQMGEGLRTLSLASGVGNIFAWIFYVAICLIPSILFAVKVLKKMVKSEDWLLLALSVALFYVMYVMINPSLTFWTVYLMEDYDAYKALFGGFIYSMIVGYIVLKAIRTFKNAEKASLCRWLNVLLIIINIVITLNVVLGAETFIERMEEAKEKNYYSDDSSEYMQFSGDSEFSEFYDEYDTQNEFDIEEQIFLTNILLLIGYVVEVITCITTIAVIVFVQKFLKEYDRSGVSLETILKANKVQSIAINAIVINVLANILYNLIQLAFYKHLLKTYAIVEFPLTSLIFILAMPLITKLIITSKEIKEENEMFI